MKRWWLMTIAVLLVAAPAAAQQGSVQVVAAGNVTTGDASRTGALQGYQPDFGVSWFQPTTNWGTVTFDGHAVRGGNDPRLGRALFAVKGLKASGLTWNLSAGDSAYTPFLTDYGFSNLFAPQVTFRGGSITAAGKNTSLSITAGRVTVFRDLFAANAETLGQSLFVARASQKVTKWFEVVAHASRVRTRDLKEFNYLIESSDDAGAGIRVNATKTLQFIADAGLTSYRRKDATNWERKPSILVGTRWTGKRGWFQVDAHRFSPGNFSVFNNSYNDREGVFAGGEYTLPAHVSVFGGWDVFGNNRQADAATAASAGNVGTASRVYGGARVPINSHLSFGARIEDGARTSKPSQYSVGYESDTGTKSAEWQLTFSKWNATGRYERRSNVDISGGLGAPTSTFTEHDVSGQLFYRATNTAQVFGTLFLTQRRDQVGGGQSFWQASAGAQIQLSRRNLFGRAEVTLSRNRELETDFLTPRSAFSGGVSAQIAKRVALSIDVYVDRSPVQLVQASPWMSRTMLRLVYTLPTGAANAASASPTGSSKIARGSETIEGTVFVDWNGDGVHNGDEDALAGVRVVLDGELGATADRNGHFKFEHIVSGPHVVTLDIPTVPADFDPPSSSSLDLSVRRNNVPNVVFGLLPLGDIEGVVLQDSNGSGAIDESDQAVDGAVVVLDDGARTEVAHNGLFRFSGVRTGTHTVQLLLESLPDGAAVAGERQAEVLVTRSQRTPLTGFLIAIEQRPEIRKIFTPKKVDGKTDAKSGGKVDRSGAKSGASKSGTSKSSDSKSGTSKSSDSKSGASKSSDSKSAASATSGATRTNASGTK
jgi:hypothetical protein